MTQKGSLCSDSPGKKSIDTLEDCQDAVGFVQAFVPNTEDSVTEEENSYWPKGCYLITCLDDDSTIFFNNASTVSSDDAVREICIPGM